MDGKMAVHLQCANVHQVLGTLGFSFYPIFRVQTDAITLVDNWDPFHPRSRSRL